jgi:general nucleoside transport system permease protein
MRPTLVPVERSTWQQFLIRTGAVLLALLLAALLLAATGKDPAEVLLEMLKGAFGSPYGLQESLVKAVPLLLCGLGVALAARMKLWNIGAEGQFFMGGFAAAGVALKAGQLPSALLLPLMALAGMLAGGLWGWVAGWMKTALKMNETITTLLLNYVAINWVTYLVYGPWKDPKGSNFPLSPIFPEGAWLPAIWGRVHVGLFAALAAAPLLWWALRTSRWGYQVRVIGESQSAAAYAGMRIGRQVLLVLFVSGALAGLAGMMEVSGVVHRLQANLSPGYGYTAIILAWVAKLNPLALVPVAILFGGLQNGGYSVQTLGVPLASVGMIQGLLLFTVLGAELLTTHRLQFARSAARPGTKEVA